MANLIGYLQGNRGEVSRLGSDTIRANLQTWDGKVDVTLSKNGDFFITIADKHGGGDAIRITGNADSGTRHALIESSVLPVSLVERG